jgi:hypothetical protein
LGEDSWNGDMRGGDAPSLFETLGFGNFLFITYFFVFVFIKITSSKVNFEVAIW